MMADETESAALERALDVVASGRPMRLDDEGRPTDEAMWELSADLKHELSQTAPDLARTVSASGGAIGVGRWWIVWTMGAAGLGLRVIRDPAPPVA
jgi:hypothetical protein